MRMPGIMFINLLAVRKSVLLWLMEFEIRMPWVFFINFFTVR